GEQGALGVGAPTDDEGVEPARERGRGGRGGHVTALSVLVVVVGPSSFRRRNRAVGCARSRPHWGAPAHPAARYTPGGGMAGSPRGRRTVVQECGETDVGHSPPD